MTVLKGRRNAAKDLSRAQALASAKALFAERGYEAATLRDIAAHCGRSTGVILMHWDSKADLYREIMGHPPVTAEMGRELLETVAAAAFRFRAYERVHLEKGALGREKAWTNRLIAESCEAALRKAGWPALEERK